MNGRRNCLRTTSGSGRSGIDVAKVIFFELRIFDSCRTHEGEVTGTIEGVKHSFARMKKNIDALQCDDFLTAPRKQQASLRLGGHEVAYQETDPRGHCLVGPQSKSTPYQSFCNTSNVVLVILKKVELKYKALSKNACFSLLVAQKTINGRGRII